GAARLANSIAVEALIEPAPEAGASSAPTPIASAVPAPAPGADESILRLADGRIPDFLVLNSGGKLVLELRHTGRKDESSRHEIAPLPRGRATHVVLSYAPGELAAYVDGKPV